MRAVLDPNVLISAVLSSESPPAALMRAWRDGRFELVASPALLLELTAALNYPKIAKRVSSEESDRYVRMLGASARVVEDPVHPPPVVSRDSDDDYLIALAHAERAALVTGDKDLLELSGSIPAMAPRKFLQLINS